MDSKTAIKYIAAVPSKYDKSGGTISGQVTVGKVGNASTINFPATVNDPGFIQHIEDNNVSKLRFVVSDDKSTDDLFEWGSSSNGQFSRCAYMNTYGDFYVHSDRLVWHSGNFDPNSKANSSHTHNYLPLSGGHLSGKLTAESNNDQINAKRGNNIAVMSTSNADGEYLFGGRSSTFNTDFIENYIRIGKNKLQYSYGKGMFDIYHQGHKPTPSEIGALNKNGDTINGDLEITSPHKLITSHNYGVAGRMSNGQSDYLIFMDTADRVHVGWHGRSIMIDDDAPITHSGYRFYHQGFKPTPNEIGAANKTSGIDNQLSNVVWNNLDNSDRVCFAYSNSNAASKPPGVDHALMQMAYNNTWKTQLAHDWRTNSVYIRTKNNGTWMNWAELYSTAHKPSPDEIGAVPKNSSSAIKIQADSNYSSDENSITIAAGKNELIIQSSMGQKLDDTIHFNGKKVMIEPDRTPLWKGCTYLNKGQNFKVNKPISQCQNGWILVFSDYDPGGNPNGNDYNWTTHLIPKNSALVNSGGNVLFSIPNNESGGWTIKAAYIKDDRIEGQSVETVAGWNDVVLREVLEY